MEEIGGTSSVCACASVRHTGRALTQLYDALLGPSGLRATQFGLLSRLDTTEPIAKSDLAMILGMDGTTLTRALAPLERQGWVRIEEGADRRTRQVWATEAGIAVVEQARPLWQQAQARVVVGFGEERLAALRRELAALTAAVR